MNIAWAALTRLRIKSTGEEGILFEATALKDFGKALIRAIDHRHRRKGSRRGADMLPDPCVAQDL